MRGRLIAGGALVLASILGLWRLFATPLNRDAGWWLFLTSEWLNGAELYVDLWEVNPPMMAYVASVPLLVARTLKTDPVTTFRIFVILLIGASVILSGVVVRKAKHEGSFVAAIAALLTVVLLVLPAAEFGQREHLMFALFSPYLFLSWARWNGRRTAAVSSFPAGLAISLGLVAAIGLGMKPHFVVLWAILEGCLFFLLDPPPWKRPETLAIAALLVAYGVGVLLVHHEYLVLLLRFREFYEGFRTQPLGVLLGARYSLPLIAALAAGVLIPQPVHTRRLTRLFVATAALAFVMAVLQRKGWAYHFYPADAASIVAVGVATFGAYSMGMPSLRRRLLRVLTVGACGVAMTLVVANRIIFPVGDPWLEEKLGVARCDDPTTDRILVLSGYMIDAFPFVNYSGCGWSAPAPFMWPVHALYRDAATDGETVRVHDIASMAEDELFFVEGIGTEFSENPPAVLLVDDSRDPVLRGARFPYLEYFAQQKDFREAIRSYVPAGRCAKFIVLVPRDVYSGFSSREIEDLCASSAAGR